ncbi:MAG: FHA domain-containing protein [Cuspidothrix sp.]
MINTTYKCPKDHDSTEADFCSECGLKINGMNEEIISSLSINKSGLTCPNCGAPHEFDSGNFCEICGYNFITGVSGEIPGFTPNLTEVKSEVALQISVVKQWQIVITIDPSLRHPDSPEAPINKPPLIIDLVQSVNLIGRNSAARAIHPEIALDFDDAVSHRHALLTLQPDSSLILRDIGSSNGTIFKGKELKPMMDITLENGDEFTLGHWTKITVKCN